MASFNTKDNQSFIYTQVRHIRILFLVDQNISERELRNLFEANMHRWGGRYNPIIPLKDGKIEHHWLEMIRHYDPDYIYHSKKLDLKWFGDQNVVHTQKCFGLDENFHSNLPGVNIHYLLSQNLSDPTFGAKLCLLNASGFTGGDYVLKDFYSLNLGLKDLFVGEGSYTTDYFNVDVPFESIKALGAFIHNRKPFFKSILSQIYINTVVPFPTNHYREEGQLVVYDPKDHLFNMLYYWNRQLYLEPSHKIQQLLVSIDELEALSAEEYASRTLQSIFNNGKIAMISFGMDQQLLQSKMESLQKNCQTVSLCLAREQKFPFLITDYRRSISEKFSESRNVIHGKEGILPLPQPNFRLYNEISAQTYIVDLTVQLYKTGTRKFLKFPFFTSFFHHVCRTDGRVNGHHDLSLFSDFRKETVDFMIPEPLELFAGLLTFRQKGDQPGYLPIKYTRPSDAGQKMQAMIHAMGNKLSTVENYIGDKFWLDIFRGQSDFPSSNIKTGKGTFSYLDLKRELNMIYWQNKDLVLKKILERSGDGTIGDPKAIKHMIDILVDEDMENHVKRDLQHLAEINAIFIGMKIRCNHCGSNKWYALNEISENTKCKGCYEFVKPVIENPIYYRVNDLFINNLLSDQTKNGKEYHGNYIVLKTLISLRNDCDFSKTSFLSCAPLEFESSGEKSFKSDIDIVALADGELILGEAKAQAREFGTKEINNLVWIADNLLPDKIILAYRSGKLSGQVDEITAKIVNKNCKVIERRISEPLYQFGYLHGLKGQT